MLRHNELMSAIKNMSNQITQSMNNLSRQIESATASINANISYVNSNISYLNDNVTYLRQEVSQARSAIISEQIETQSLIKEGNRIASMNYAANRDAVKSLESIKMAMYR
jgi:tRNA U34 5-carboxymethylaminomethyl modifying GTPase MnmE/TrmE